MLVLRNFKVNVISTKHLHKCKSNLKKRCYRIKIMRAKENEESTESVFARELRRRGIRTISDIKDEPIKGEYQVKVEEEDQYIKSKALSSEGLEGLIPRAKELLKLGGTFFLAFLPAIIVISIIGTITFAMFGEKFIHGGTEKSLPPLYIDPYELIKDPNFDPYKKLKQEQTLELESMSSPDVKD